MPTPVLYYIRHGQTDWNAEQRFQGRRDVALNNIGREQAHENGLRLKQLVTSPEDFDFVASPLGRTRETMQIIRSAMSLEPKAYIIEPTLMEMDYGDLEGVTLETIERDSPEIYSQRMQDRWNFQPPNGENLQMTMERIVPYFRGIERNMIIVGHGSVGRALRKHLLNLEANDAAWFEFPQNRIFRFSGGIEAQF